MNKFRRHCGFEFLLAFAVIIILTQMLPSCTITNHSIKIKNNGGNIFLNQPDTLKAFPYNSILNNPVPLSTLLSNSVGDTSSSFRIYLLNKSDNSFIEAFSTSKRNDSIAFVIHLVDKSKHTSDTMEITLSRYDLNANQFIFKTNSDFDIAFDTARNGEGRRLIFSITKFNAFAYNNSQFQLLTGELNNQINQYSFFIINDPETINIPIITACILSFCKSWEDKCRKDADSIAQKKKTRCKYQVRYKNFRWLAFDKEVYCEIICP